MFSTRLALLKVHTVDSISKSMRERFTTLLLGEREHVAYQYEKSAKPSSPSESAEDILSPQGSSAGTPPLSRFSSGTPPSRSLITSSDPTYPLGGCTTAYVPHFQRLGIYRDNALRRCTQNR